MRMLAPVAIVIAVVVGAKLLIENILGIDTAPMVEGWIQSAGTSEALLIVTLLAVDILLPVPSSLVMIVSGAAFGVWWGSVLALSGSIAGEWLGFELARRYGARASTWLVGPTDTERLARLFSRHGAAAVAISRALPILMETLSVVAGLSGMRRRTFLAASFVGTAPIVVAYAYAGAASREAGSVVPAIIITIAVFGLGWIAYRARLTASAE